MLEDYFAKKRAELGMDRANTLAGVQAALDDWYPGQTRARQLHRGVLRVITPNAAVANELRMRQVELLSRFAEHNIERLQISIQSLS